MNKKITFDTFIRGCITCVLFAAAILLINYLSGVLLPFFVALLLAYMLNPFVEFFQHRCHLRNRVVSVILTLLLATVVIALILWLIIPPMVEQCIKFKDITVVYINHLIAKGVLPRDMAAYAIRYINHLNLSQKDYMSIVQEVFPWLMTIVGQTVTFVTGLFQIVMTFLYLVFIMIDYDHITGGWIRLIPARRKPMVLKLFYNVKSQMNGYFRGQALIAFLVGVLFCIGFSIIGFPMAIGLGIFVGFLNLVPYMQNIGFIPTALLAFLKAADTGENGWFIFLQALIVFAVVQAIQDVFLTPKIMGKQMGLNPAVILLSLSIWGALLGLIGLIIALPLTSLLKAYYSEYIEKSNREFAEQQIITNDEADM